MPNAASASGKSNSRSGYRRAAAARRLREISAAIAGTMSFDKVRCSTTSIRDASSGARGFFLYGNSIPRADIALIVRIDNLWRPVSITV
jgi:hypothetical protein